MINIIQILEKKSKGLNLSKEEIIFFINGLMENTIKDFQISALLMAIKINGFNDQELIDYSNALLNSGEILPLDENLVDKHSSGGIGDKTSICLLPILGAMGLKIFKISGRGLGYTGGTIDKLESLKGFKIEKSLSELKEMINEIGISITGQIDFLTPADGKIYELRDLTATVDSMPLIAASIISKKLATGSKNILIDIKIGTGAFIDNIEDGKILAELMKKIAKSFDRNLFILFSSMDQPLGNSVGNKQEVLEAIEFLKGNGSDDLKELIKKIATELYSKSKNTSIEEAEKIYEHVIKSGEAFDLQKKWFEKHGIENYEESIEFKPKFRKIINSNETGFVSFKNVKNFGNSLIELGAGRKEKGQKLDFDSGINFFVKKGEKVEKGEKLFEITSSKEIPNSIVESILNNYSFDKEPKKSEVILGEITW